MLLTGDMKLSSSALTDLRLWIDPAESDTRGEPED